MSACLLLAVLIVSALFPDVLFMGRTLQPSVITPHMGRPAHWQASSWLPLLNPAAEVTDGFADLNASAWQYEPARYLMARNFRAGESPWWNPYSASGTLGVETLVDLKFAPHTLLSAWLFDASPASFDIGLLVVDAAGVFCVLLALRYFFCLGWLAAIAGGAVYLLNGFALPNLESHIGQPYFFSPFLLIAVLAFAQKQTVWRWFWLVLAQALLFSLTILTTLTLVLVTLHAIGLVFCWQLQGSGNRFWLLRYTGLVLAAGLVALLLLGPLWFPVINSFFVTDMVSDFESRMLQKPRDLENLLSVFTPRHFWENNYHINRTMLYPAAGLEKNELLIAHSGIVASIVAAHAFPRDRRWPGALVALCVGLLVFSYARVFGFASFVSYIPVLRSIGSQYWGCMAGLVFILLTAFGLQHIRSGNAASWPAVAVLALQLIGFLLLYRLPGLAGTFPRSPYLWLATGLFLLSLLAVVMIRQRWLSPRILSVLLLVLMVLELLCYLNPLRPQRYSPLMQPPAFVSFLKAHIGYGRVLNVGQANTLYPEYGAMFGIRQADTQNPGLLPWYERFFERHFGNDTFFFLSLDGSTDRKRKKAARKDYVLDANALDAASVRYVLVSEAATTYQEFLQVSGYPLVFRGDGVSIFENIDSLPVVSLVCALGRADSLSPDLDPHVAAISDDEQLLSAARQLGIPSSSAREVAAGTVNLFAYHNTEVTAETSAVQPVVLVLSDTWHPAWRATVDGQPVYVGRVNEAFRGIVLPAGKHRIRFFYAPPSLHYGMVAAAVTALGLFLLLVFHGRQQEASHEQ